MRCLPRTWVARRFLLALLAGCLASMMLGAVAMAATPTPVVVSDCTDSSGLSAALANNGTDVAVTFSCSGTIPIAAPLVVGAGDTVSIAGAGQSVVLEGAGASQILLVEGGTLTLSGLTLQDARASGAPGIGGPLHMPYPEPAAASGANSTDPSEPGGDGENGANGASGSAGAAGQGGALFIAPASNVAIEDVTFAHDLAAGGAGGIGWYGEWGGKGGYGANGTAAHPEGSAGGNSGSGGDGGAGGAGGAGQGGAIYNAGTLTITGSTFSEDQAAGGLGGAGGYGGDPGIQPENPNFPAPHGGDGFSFESEVAPKLNLEGGNGGFGGSTGNQGNGGNGGAGGPGEGGAIYNAGTLSISGSTFSADTATGALGGNGQQPFGGNIDHSGDGGTGGNSLDPNGNDPESNGSGGGNGGTGGNGGNGANGGNGGGGGDGAGGAIASAPSLTASADTYAADAVNAGTGGNGGYPGSGTCGGWGGVGGRTDDVAPPGTVNPGYTRLQATAFTNDYLHPSADYDCSTDVSGYLPAGGAGGVPGSMTPEGAPGSNPEAVLQPAFPAQPAQSGGYYVGSVGGGAPEFVAAMCDPRDGQSYCLSGITAADGSGGLDGMGGHGGAAGSVASPVDVAILSLSPTITLSSLPNAQLGSEYNATLSAGGGTPPYTWSVSAGSLPAGLSLNPSSGQISGTPTHVETATFTVSLTDSSIPSQSATQSLSIAVLPAAEQTPTNKTPATGSSSSTGTGVSVADLIPGGKYTTTGSGKGKPLTTAQKRANAIKACNKIKKAKKRASCVMAAKKRYPLPKAKPKKKAKKK